MCSCESRSYLHEPLRELSQVRPMEKYWQYLSKLLLNCLEVFLCHNQYEMRFTFLQSHQEVYCRHQGGSYVCEGIRLSWGSISQDTWCEYRSNAANVFKPFEKLRFTCMNTATMFSCYFFFIKFQLRAALKDFTRAIHLRPDVHHYYMYRVNILWYIKFR